MKITELIHQLTLILNVDGDIECCTLDQEANQLDDIILKVVKEGNDKKVEIF